MYSHKAGTETIRAGEIFIAGGLVDLSLATEIGLQRLNRHTVGLQATISATLTDAVVDEITF